MENKLKFGNGNKKLAKYITHFSLPAGHACPFAKDCLSKANRLTGKIIDGKHCQFRCYAASEEAVFTAARKSRWHNFDILTKASGVKKKAAIIENSLPDSFIVRIHVGGDYFSQSYFDAWLTVAQNNPHVRFYGYTKSLPFWVKRLDEIPGNFVLTASRGGKKDSLIDEYGLRTAEVVYSVMEAVEKDLPIDNDDSIAMNPNAGNFALLIHGMGPKGSLQAKLHHKKRQQKSLAKKAVLA